MNKLREYGKQFRDRFWDLYYRLGLRRVSYSGSLGKRMVLQYFLSLLGVAVGTAVVALLVRIYLGSTSWWQELPRLSQFIYFCWRGGWLLVGSIIGVGWAICTICLPFRPLRYLDQLVDAAEDLARDPSRPIYLPEPLWKAQNQLNQAREKAQKDAEAAREAEQRKNDLIVYLAHDLKTPLTSVVGYLSLLRDEPQISPELRERYTGIALEKALRLEDLINEFFDITRFNLTSLALEPERTDLGRMLEQLASEFLPILGEKDLTWEARIAPGVELLCDRDKLQRVLDNLIRNAVSYSYPGTAITLTMAREGDEAVLTVQNHGRTIPPEKLERIFQQFYRVDTSRSSSTGGAGLGLAIAKEIVELHGGSIRAESESESITFTVRLPVG